MSLKIKKDDKVVVLSGKDGEKKRKVIKVEIITLAPEVV